MVDLTLIRPGPWRGDQLTAQPSPENDDLEEGEKTYPNNNCGDFPRAHGTLGG